MSFNRTIETVIIIDATPEKVYSIMSNLEAYVEWSPFIKSISGNLIVGEELNVFIQPVGERGMTFKPLVLKVERNKEIRWIGKLGMTGIFDGEHYFILEGTTDGKTKLIHGEKFSGVFVPFLWTMVKVNTEKGFVAHNLALKKLAQS